VDFRRGSTYTVRVRCSLIHQCIVSWHLKSSAALSFLLSCVSIQLFSV
jgi:hypothetical protein